MDNSKKQEKETPQVPQSDSEKKEKTSCHRTQSLITGVTFVIAVVAIVMTLFNAQANKQIQKNLLNANNNFKSEVGQLKENQDKAQQQINTKTEDISQGQNDLQIKIDDLNKALQTAMNQRLYQSQDWLLLKARYYLELAQINAEWSDNFAATISLLQEADKLMKQLNNPKIFDLRKIIAQEIATLQATPTQDIAGLLSQLDAAQASVTGLTIQTPLETNKPKQETDPLQPVNTSSWKTQFQNSLQVLEKLVIVRRSDEDIKPLMSPLFESILRESIRLNLQEAQWAILNNNPAVYQLALKQAIGNLKRTFNKDAQSTSALLKQLNELQQVNLAQKKPFIGEALPLLNKIIDNKELGNQENNTEGDIKP